MRDVTGLSVRLTADQRQHLKHILSELRKLRVEEFSRDDLMRDCAWCGRPFQPRISTARYCSKTHKNAAYELRRRRVAA